jgi:hypothetical protein
MIRLFKNFYVSVVARRWNLILSSLLNTFEKLKKLGFSYHNGTVIVILPHRGEKKEGHE